MRIRTTGPRLRGSSCLAALLAASACGGFRADGPAVPLVDSTPIVRIIQGKSAADTIGAKLSEPLVAEVRGAGTHAPRSGVEVRFTVIDSIFATQDIGITRAGDTVTAHTVVATTDVSGQAAVRVQLGSHAGTRHVTASFQSSSDTATYVTLPGRPVAMRAVPAIKSSAV